MEAAVKRRWARLRRRINWLVIAMRPSTCWMSGGDEQPVLVVWAFRSHTAVSTEMSVIDQVIVLHGLADAIEHEALCQGAHT
jgi:hypothetical protein